MSTARRLVAALAVALLACALPTTLRAQAADADGDGLSDEWETMFGLDPLSAVGVDGAGGDPDADGSGNAAEWLAGTHPRGSFTRAFAEGSTGPFFDTRFALFNASPQRSAHVLLRFMTSDGRRYSTFLLLGPHTRASVDPETINGLEAAAFSTVVEADAEVVADRTMWWDATHYGSHAESGTHGAALAWFLAEGATHSGFDLFYLVQNPGAEPASVTVTYLLPAGPPIVKSYTVAALSRFNIWVDLEDPALAATDVSAAITSSSPIVVERAMYLGGNGRAFAAGHASAGVTAPAREWYLAEGATGSFFDLFVLVANPGDAAAEVVATFLLPDGSTVERPFDVPAKTRYTLWVDTLDARLADTSISTVIRSVNGVPVIAERAMWWPGNAWSEAHNSAGATAGGATWALAEGEAGGPDNVQTYVLVANTGTASTEIELSVFFEDGGSRTHSFTAPPSSRSTIDIGWQFASEFPPSQPRRFATLVRGLATPSPRLVVERAMYSDAGGTHWAAGTNALGSLVSDVTGGPPQEVPTLAIIAADGDAAEAGMERGLLIVSRSPATGTLVVPLIVTGSASSSDIGPLPRELVFAPGVTSLPVAVTPTDDDVVETPEFVVVTIASVAGHAVTSSSAAVRIVDDDVSGGTTAPALDAAARFLAQATFGPATQEIERLRALGYDAWIAEQIGQPRSSFLGYLDAAAAAGETVSQNQVQEAWFQSAVTGPDQLRQRVANALLEILVVGASGGLSGGSYEFAAYMDVLMRNAFGNFRTLIEHVTLSPTMGRYLDMLRNQREDPRAGRIPNENYARELLQLFTTGLYQIGPDGSVLRDGSGNPIPTYGQEEISGFARVFTGWTFNQAQPATNFYAPADWRNPMVQAVDSRTGLATRHSTLAKPLLEGAILPAIAAPNATAAQASADLQAALDNVFAHPNVGPFIGRQLIQRLVTSNPSPAYVARVAAAFDDNGAGVRGDLAAVVRAILLDREAREPDTARNPYYGHLREPMIRFVTVLRAFNGKAASGKFKLYSLQTDMGQAPFRSPSVFNFFAPDYQRPGAIAEAGLVAPEFQITSETTAIRSMNTMRSLVYRTAGTNADAIVLDLSQEESLAGDPDRLLDRLNALLFAGGLSTELRAIVRDAVMASPATRPLDRARTAVYLLVTSPEFVVQK
jgi:uncharacterized protein (DUF1800 family)